MKVYQQADFLVRQAQIRQKLCFVDGEQFFDCFDFYDDFVFDYKIESISAVEFHVFVDDRQRSLFFHTKTLPLQFKQ